MAKRQSQQEAPQLDLHELVELTRTLLIVQLGLAKVPQDNIRLIAGCSINRVNATLQLVAPKKK